MDHLRETRTQSELFPVDGQEGGPVVRALAEGLGSLASSLCSPTGFLHEPW